MFNEDSGLVKVWVRLIIEGKRTIEEVPNLSNLKTIVENLVSH
jgi:hypothetical protein